MLNVQTEGVEQFENKKMNLSVVFTVGESLVHPDKSDVTSPQTAGGLGSTTPKIKKIHQNNFRVVW